MSEAFICDYIRTPIGRYGGALSSIRADDLAAIPIAALIERHPQLDSGSVDEVILGCANQSGEDNRNVARMALLLAGLPETVPGSTINRLCGSGLDAIISAARTIQCGQSDMMIAGGIESMSRAPFVLPKAESAFSRAHEIYDTTLGWRFINPLIQKHYGVDSMPETAENVAEDFAITREAQDQFAFNSQRKAGIAQASGRLAQEIVGVPILQKRSDPIMVMTDEHPRPDTTLEQLAKLNTPFRVGGSVTAGNASGINDGASAVLIASEAAIKRFHLTPIARIMGGVSVGVAPRIMGYGPAPAIKKLCYKHGLSLSNIGVIEINEAFASQVLASMHHLGLNDDDPRVNLNGGAIALGHPLGMSGVRITGSMALELQLRSASFGIAAMCVGVGQGIAIALARV